VGGIKYKMNVEL